MFKRLLCIVLSIVMAAALAGCGGSPSPGSGTPSNTGSAPPVSETPSNSGTAPPAASETPSVEPTTGPVAETGGYLTVYYSHSSDWADPIVQEFEEKYGIEVDLVSGPTGNLISRMQAEVNNPLCDVLWGGREESFAAARDLFYPYESTEIDNLIEVTYEPSHLWYGFFNSPMVLIYNTDMVSEEEAPKGWSDLLNPKWKGTIATADPISTSSSLVSFMVMMMVYGKDDGGGYQFIRDLVANLDGIVLSGSGGVYKGVADGEYAIGLTYEDAALKYVASGSPMAIVYPEEGTTMSPSPVAIANGAPNLENAKLFVDFVLGRQVQEEIGESFHRTVRKDVPVSELTPDAGDMTLIEYDLNWITENYEEFTEFWKDTVAS